MISPDDPLRDQRASRKVLLAGLTDAPIECVDCYEDNPLELSLASDGAIRCDECERKRVGTSPIAEHHPARRKNDPNFVVPTGTNDHRVFTALWRLWPKADRESRGRGPLYGFVTARRGILDIQRRCLEHGEREGSFIAYLDQLLRAKLGDDWLPILEAMENKK